MRIPDRNILHSAGAYQGRYQKEMLCERRNWKGKIISD